jgi:hypothetical protein
VQLLLPLGSKRMQPRPEERLHLLDRDRIARVEAIDPSQSRANPHAGRLTALGVVGGQSDMTLLGRIQRCNLPSQ